MRPGQANSMASFTADFFGALQSTFTDNSLNNSKCDLSQSYANKSQLFREIKEESVIKINQIVEKMTKSVVFDSIFVFGLRKKRREARTPLNMHKHAYKIELMFNMKKSAKCQWAFHRIIKFTQQSSMQEATQKINRDRKQQAEIVIMKKEISQQGSMINHFNKSNAPEKSIMAVDIVETAIDGRIGTLDNSISIMKDASPLCQIFIELFTNRRYLQYALVRIREYEHYVTKKSYICEILLFLVNKARRNAFISLLNAPSPIKKQQPIKNQLIDAQDNYLLSSSMGRQLKPGQNNAEPYGFEHNIKFKKTFKKAGREQGQPESLSANKKKNTVRPGALKFNRCSIKKSSHDLKEEIQQKPQSIYEKRSPLKNSIYLNQSKVVKILMVPQPRIQTQIIQFPIQRFCRWEQFNCFKNTYHLSAQQIKQEVADINDQMITFEDDLKNSKCSSKQKGLIFSRIHKLDSKMPLEFSSKKQRSKYTSSQKSKKSIRKSEEDQPETMNYQSMNYYFPEVQKVGKTITRQTSTRFIGSTNWAGCEPKKRVSTQVIIRNMKNNDKANPYLHQLKQKIKRKQSERVISLNKMVERSLSARSNSRNSKTSREEKKVQNELLVRNAQSSKNIKGKHVSPQILHDSSRTPQPGVPKQWNFYQSNVGHFESPAKNLRQSSVKTSLQFQKVAKNSKK